MGAITDQRVFSLRQTEREEEIIRACMYANTDDLFSPPNYKEVDTCKNNRYLGVITRGRKKGSRIYRDSV